MGGEKATETNLAVRDWKLEPFHQQYLSLHDLKHHGLYSLLQSDSFKP